MASIPNGGSNDNVNENFASNYKVPKKFITIAIIKSLTLHAFYPNISFLPIQFPINFLAIYGFGS